jgi:nucleoside-diphosphate-sugar epimerase
MDRCACGYLALLQSLLAILGVVMRLRKDHAPPMTHAVAQPSAPLHVIIGSGQIGPQVAERLLARGLRVRLVRRGPGRTLPAGAEGVRADVTNPAEAAEAVRGASVVYHTANPRYHRWAEELLPLARGITAGARATGARLVVLDNLYAYGVPADGRMSEATPVAPVSKKGALRAEAAQFLLAAHARGDVPVTILRPSDFVGPGVINSQLGERFWTRLFAGKPVEVLGDPTQPHSFSYSPDVADALVTLACAGDDAYGEVWHPPVLAAEPMLAWLERFAALAGVTPRTKELTPFLLRFASLFIREAGELPEMLYQWRSPFVLDDTRFRARFGAVPTPRERVLADTFSWAAARYRTAQAA